MVRSQVSVVLLIDAVCEHDISFLRLAEQRVHILQLSSRSLGIIPPNDLIVVSFNARTRKGGTYRCTNKVDDHEEEVDAAPPLGQPDGPDVAHEKAAYGPSAGGKVETPGSHGGRENLRRVDPCSWAEAEGVSDGVYEDEDDADGVCCAGRVVWVGKG